MGIGVYGDDVEGGTHLCGGPLWKMWQKLVKSSEVEEKKSVIREKKSVKWMGSVIKTPDSQWLRKEKIACVHHLSQMETV